MLDEMRGKYFWKQLQTLTSSRGEDIFLGLKERGTSGYR